MKKQNNNKNLDEIPDRVLKLSEDILGFYPSIIETDFYTIDAIKSDFIKK
jgi:hypothetical protein